MSVNSIRSLIDQSSDTYADKIALIDGNISFTYAELFEKVNQIAHYLDDMGYPKGTRIGIYSNKSYSQVIAILALLSTKYIFVPIAKVLKPEQVKYIIDDCDIKCIITDKHKIDEIRETRFDGTIITYETMDKDGISFEEIYKYCQKDYTSEVKAHDNAVITYSFGLSGNPKGIVISHQNLIDGARVVTNYLKIREDDVLSGVMSFNLDYGLNQIFCSLYKRATLAIHKFILPGDFFDHLLHNKVTVLAIMPIHISKMFDEDPHRLPTPEQLGNLRTITSSGGNITDKMIKDIKSYFPNALFYSMHGLTEAFRSAYLDPAQINIRPTSIGKAIPDVELYVINKDGEECAPREVGELIHRGVCIYKGYWNAREESDARFKSIKILEKVVDLDGDLNDEIVVASGDYVYKDEEGYLYFDSRHDDMIKTAGYRVNPYEIEKVAKANIPAIEECAVFSIKDEKIEEAIVLAYTANSQIPQNEIIFTLKKHLPAHMIPAKFLYKKVFPYYYGEIDKNVLKREVEVW